MKIVRDNLVKIEIYVTLSYSIFGILHIFITFELHDKLFGKRLNHVILFGINVK